MIRLLFWVFIVYVIYRFVKSHVSPSAPTRERPGDMEADLVKDPQCGTYFLRHQGVHARVSRQDLYFCSPECRDAFLDELGGRKKKRKHESDEGEETNP